MGLQVPIDNPGQGELVYAGTQTLAADPGVGQWKTDAGDTRLDIHATTQNGVSMASILEQMDTGGFIQLRTGGQDRIYSVQSSTSHVTWFELEVTVESSSSAFALTASDVHSLTVVLPKGAAGGGGVTDHGELTGRTDDDHPQYFNQARGDVRYFTQAQVTASLGTKSDVGHAHDERYYTEAETDAALALKAATADARFPTATEKAALAGTNGAPDGLNRYVTDSDPHMTDDRHGTAASVGDHTDVDITTDPVTEGETLVWRTNRFVPEPQSGGGQTNTVQGDNVGTQNTGTDVDAVIAPIFGAGAGQIAEGNHSHATLPTADQKAALDGAALPSAVNVFATMADVGAAGGGTVTSVGITPTDGIEVDSGSPVTTSGAIQLGVNATALKTHLSLNNVDNTADADKPVSTAQQTALNLKADTASLGTAAAANTGTTAGTVPAHTADGQLTLNDGVNVSTYDASGVNPQGNQNFNVGGTVAADPHDLSLSGGTSNAVSTKGGQTFARGGRALGATSVGGDLNLYGGLGTSANGDVVVGGYNDGVDTIQAREVRFLKGFSIVESVDAPLALPAGANKGQLWVRSSDGALMYRYEDGSDVTLSTGGSPLTADELAAIQGAATPSAANVFATMADVGAAGGGTVTSVAITPTDGLQVDSGSPITTSGAITLGVDATALLSHLGVEAGATADQTAVEVPYTNATSGLVATNVQAALDEIDGNLDGHNHDASYAPIGHVNSTSGHPVAVGANPGPETAGFMSGADKTKLDAIEAGATGDQTGAEIKALYEAELDTNAFTDAEKTKLAGVEDGAVAAGATGDSFAATHPGGNQHIDWTVTGAEDIHIDRIVAGAVTQHQAAINHNALLNYSANRHFYTFIQQADPVATAVDGDVWIETSA